LIQLAIIVLSSIVKVYSKSTQVSIEKLDQ
jgi:hypothetical protein